MEFFIILVGIAINLAVSYFIIRAAAASALKTTMEQDRASGELLAILKRIEKLLEARPTHPIAAPSLPMKSINDSEIKQSGISVSEAKQGGAHLIPSGDDFSFSCSECGTRQHADRTVCYLCGSPFVKP